MAVDKKNDSLATSEDFGFSTGWEWKQEYIQRLGHTNDSKDGLERFSQMSASPDTTALFAGPARFTAIGSEAQLTPIGLIDGLQISANPMLQRLFEMGSNRSFFTRGKTITQMSFSKMLANQANILAALQQNAYIPADMSSDGGRAAGADSPNTKIMHNLDSEYFAVPFGLLIVFKSRGGGNGGSGTGQVLSAIYAEYCMFSNYNFNVSNNSPVIMENVAIECDRIVPVAFD